MPDHIVGLLEEDGGQRPGRLQLHPLAVGHLHRRDDVCARLGSTHPLVGGGQSRPSHVAGACLWGTLGGASLDRHPPGQG